MNLEQGTNCSTGNVPFVLQQASPGSYTGGGHRSLKGNKTGLVQCISAFQGPWWEIPSHLFLEISPPLPSPLSWAKA